MKKVVICILLASFTMMGCGGGQAPPSAKKPITEINYNIVDTQSDEFNTSGTLKNWYLANYKVKGKYTQDFGGLTYVLVSLGEKRSGGYSLDVVDIVATDKIIVRTNLTKPSPEQVKISMITYPHLLIAIPQDMRNIVWENTI